MKTKFSALELFCIHSVECDGVSQIRAERADMEKRNSIFAVTRYFAIVSTHLLQTLQHNLMHIERWTERSESALSRFTCYAQYMARDFP